jgi:hypothetical protein
MKSRYSEGARNRPGVAQRVPGGLGSQISWHSAHEGGEVVSLTHRPPLPPGMFPVLIFTRGRVDPRAMVRSKGNTSMSLKNPVTPPGIDPGTARLVAQRLNHYATPGHPVILTDINCSITTSCYENSEILKTLEYQHCNTEQYYSFPLHVYSYKCYIFTDSDVRILLELLSFHSFIENLSCINKTQWTRKIK